MDQVEKDLGDLALTTFDPKSVKENTRLEIWDKMKAKNLEVKVAWERSRKIPFFKGYKKAGNRVARLREFRSAQVVKVNPSMAQMHLRYLILKAQKKLIVPNPALTEEEAFYLIDGSGFSDSKCHKAATKNGAKAIGKHMTLDWPSDFKIDLYVVASVAVSLNGVRIGKGMGYAEIEWAILHELGLVDENTLVLTTVHDEQIVNLDKNLMLDHDLPVDVIVTPKRIINVRQKLSKPKCGVKWNLVTEQVLKDIPLLNKLKEEAKTHLTEN